MNNEKILENVKLKLAASNYEENINHATSKKIALKLVATMCLLLISVAGIANAKEIKKHIENTFGLGNKRGVELSIENGYVSYPEVDYKKSLNGIQVGVEAFLIDEFTLCFDFDVILPDKYYNEVENLNGEHSLGFENMQVLDENNNKIFEMKKFFSVSGARFPYDIGARIRSRSDKIEANEYKISYQMTGSFSKPKTMKVILENLSILDGGDKTKRKYNGRYKFTLDVPENMYNSQTREFTVISCNDDTTKVKKAILSNTELYIEYETQRMDAKLGQEYVTTEDGRKFGRSNGDGGQWHRPNSPTEEDPIVRVAPYELTIFDKPDIITYHIPTNDGKEITIELKNNN